jgi:hypothetical protein
MKLRLIGEKNGVRDWGASEKLDGRLVRAEHWGSYEK